MRRLDKAAAFALSGALFAVAFVGCRDDMNKLRVSPGGQGGSADGGGNVPAGSGGSLGIDAPMGGGVGTDAPMSGGGGAGNDGSVETGGAGGSGGVVGTGGTVGSDGQVGTGGVGTGGATGSGGVLMGTGGIVESGGVVETGGIVGSGGSVGTGGVGTGGATGSGGVPVGTGGIVGSGGVVETGGIVGSGGSVGTGGVGTGGATGTGGVSGGGSGGTPYGLTCTTTQECGPYATCCDGSNESCDGTRLPPGDGTYVDSHGNSQYVVSDDQLTVTDTITGLVWQRDGSGTRTGCSGSSNLTCTWAEAKAYCAGLTLGGLSGWRLPAVMELRTIVDVTRTNPLVDPAAFPSTPSAYFWTSSPSAGPPGFAWYVSFHLGYSYDDVVGYLNRVRCVR
jgi:hypothetical protein